MKLWKKWTLWNGTKNKLLVVTFWLKPHNAIYVILFRHIVLLVCWEFWLKGNCTLAELLPNVCPCGEVL